MTRAMTIDGRAVTGRTEHDVVDPATGCRFATAPDCDGEQLDAAVVAAQRAYPAWSEDEPARRAALTDAAERLERRASEIAPLLTAEQGKPLAMAGAEVLGAAAALRATARAPLPREIVQDDHEARIEAVGRSLGVVAAITPWNFPVVITANKIAPALLCGNTVVAKPSPFTPLAVLAMAEAIRDAFPAGVLNVVSGGDALGARLAAHAGVRKITFTGSVSAGRAVAAAAAADLKRVTLELGGNDAAILLDDFDTAAMIEGLFWGAFLNSGQVCAAVKRVYVPESRRDEITEALAARASASRMGPGTESRVELGPLQNRAQRDRVEGLVADAVAAGARCVTGGARRDGEGFFYEPTILTDARAGMAIVDEEQFGPALPVLGYRAVEDAVTAANATRYGLSGSVWSADEERAASIAGRLRCGTAWVNTHALPLPSAPFGGRDWSGIGVEGGRWGLEAFVDWQTTYVGREATSGAGGALASEEVAT